MPPRIRLFRRPLLDEWVESGVPLQNLVTHVLIHEIGHHFGFSDADMEAIDEGEGE
jgi:predicted Zn-dependent protease with MMP-like domain